MNLDHPGYRFYQMMWDEINTFKYNDILELGFYLLENVPEYFFTVPASSSGKYHPINDLGTGGLVRHSLSVKRMLDHLFEPYGYYEFDARHKELLQLAALFHDCMKSGTQEEYEKNKHTKFLHPIFAANFIVLKACEIGFNYTDAQFIASAISTHMGQWSKGKKDEKLPEPQEPYQKVLHLADYLASRKDISIETSDPDEPVEMEIDEEIISAVTINEKGE